MVARADRLCCVDQERGYGYGSYQQRDRVGSSSGSLLFGGGGDDGDDLRKSPVFFLTKQVGNIPDNVGTGWITAKWEVCNIAERSCAEVIDRKLRKLGNCFGRGVAESKTGLRRKKKKKVLFAINFNSWHAIFCCRILVRRIWPTVESPWLVMFS
ncbi:hypothetical protein F4811DRAFT_265351 [Daldinia bambusicola]|nr:hypothetical protein F4811DRAFT_265351 [Daldinia bambusicola]